jgi:hypothetical protein
VYKIERDNPSLYLESMTSANGLFPVKSDLFVLTSTAFQKVDSTRVITKIADNFESGLDGIVMIAEDEFIISDYHGIIYAVSGNKITNSAYLSFSFYPKLHPNKSV